MQNKLNLLEPLIDRKLPRRNNKAVENLIQAYAVKGEYKVEGIR